jgi:chorismate-pyruvate lyase
MSFNLNRVQYSSHTQYDSLLRLLLTHDGSTTRLCSAVNNNAMAIHLHEQYILSTTESSLSPLVNELNTILGGTHWLQRITSLHNADGDVFMDNLSFTRLDAVPNWFVNALNEGKMPIGKLLDQLFIQRKPVDTSSSLQALLWNTVGLTDQRASRSYKITTPDNAFMLIFEVFRDAVRFKLT